MCQMSDQSRSECKTIVAECGYTGISGGKTSLDLSGPYPKTLSGNKYIIDFVDWYSGWSEAFAVPGKTAETVAHLIIEKVYPRFGCPLELVTYNGSKNVNRVVKETLIVLRPHTTIQLVTVKLKGFIVPCMIS